MWWGNCNETKRFYCVGVFWKVAGMVPHKVWRLQSAFPNLYRWGHNETTCKHGKFVEPLSRLVWKGLRKSLPSDCIRGDLFYVDMDLDMSTSQTCSEPVILEIWFPVTSECLQKKPSLFGSLCEPLVNPLWQCIWRLLVIISVVDPIMITVRFLFNSWQAFNPGSLSFMICSNVVSSIALEINPTRLPSRSYLGKTMVWYMEQ